MFDPLDKDNLPYFNALSNKRKWAFLALTIENIALQTWRLFFWILMFCGLWMLGVPSFLGQIASVLTAFIFIAGCAYFFKNDILYFRFPKQNALDIAIEKQSSAARGTISLLNDELANPQKRNSRDLWHHAKNKILRAVPNLKSPRPRHIISRNDPLALRLIAMLIFIAGLLVSGSNAANKISNGIMPISVSSVISQGRDTSIWIKPPEYTQIEQTHITGNIAPDQVLNIAKGSKIRVRIHSLLGKNIPPIFYNGDIKAEMTYMGEGLYGIETVIENASSITVKQGIITRLSLDYNFIEDRPPEIYFAKTPYEIMENAKTRFNLVVKDDYGAKELHMSMNINEMVEDLPLGTYYEQSRLIMSKPNTEFKISPIYDLTWHTWAGLPVTFEYIVTDHSEQKTTLGEIELILPEREFKHPMAKAIIAMRKHLAWDYNDSFIDISRNLEILLSAPDYFQNDKTIYLALRSASSRLLYSDGYEGQSRIKTALAVIDLLWNIAIVIEDGDLSQAMRELRIAQRNLENATNDPNSTDKEISDLMDRLRDKMANYFTEMQREAQKNMGNGDNFPQPTADDFGQIISPNALSSLMEQIESALKSGDTEKANELMAQLQRMMEMLDPSMSSQLPKDMQAMREGVNELQELIDGQKNLLAQTLEQAINAAIIDTSQNKVEQEALRYILGQLMLDISEKLDEIPETMGLAEQEMRMSENTLGNNEPIQSIPHQEQAIKHLKSAKQELSAQYKSRMKQMVGIGFNAARKLDPLGRDYSNQSNDVKIPDEAQKQRLDEVLKTLRDRSGDRSRPDEELDYLRRLLRQF